MRDRDTVQDLYTVTIIASTILLLDNAYTVLLNCVAMGYLLIVQVNKSNPK